MHKIPTAEQSALQQQFFASLGAFINSYASVENMLRDLMTHFAGLDEQTALALFSGVRTQEAIKFIRRMHTARRKTVQPGLDLALRQLAIICEFRNDLLHHRVDFSDTPPVATNRATVLSEAAVRETVIDAHTLENAEQDLATISLVFTVFLQDFEDSANLTWLTEDTWLNKPRSRPGKRPSSNAD